MSESTKEATVILFPRNSAETTSASLGQLENFGEEALPKVARLNRADPFLELDELLPEIFKSNVMNTLAMIANDIDYETARLNAARVVDFIRQTKRKNKRMPTGSEIEYFINYE